MQIGDLAKALGVTTKTLRHYEKAGLIPAAERSENGYRNYSAEAVQRARLVVGLRSCELSIPVIKSALTDQNGSSLRQRVLGILEQQIQDYALQIAILQGQHDDLEARYHALLMTPRDRPDDCVCDAIASTCTCRSAAAPTAKRAAKSR